MEVFGGSQKPEGWDWYCETMSRGLYSLTCTSLSDGPGEEEGGYTHSLVFAMHEGSVLLGLKRRGFGTGTWNGIGGKLDVGESPRCCIMREAVEEAQLVLEPHQLTLVGRIQITVPPPNAESVCIAVYTAEVNSYQMENVQDSDELFLSWHSLLNPHPNPTTTTTTTTTNSSNSRSGRETMANLPWPKMRPEHTIYLAPLLLHQLKKQLHASEQRLRFELDVLFHPEQSSVEHKLPSERPENNRSVHEWKLVLHHSSSADLQPAKQGEQEEEEEEQEEEGEGEERDSDSGSEVSYQSFGPPPPRW